MKEKELYPSIATALENEGYLTFEQFQFLNPLFNEQQAHGCIEADVVGFKWTDEGDIEAVAVEAKRGEARDTPLSVIPQALLYQVQFPSVYVACGTREVNILEFIKKPIRWLGLGYVYASPQHARIVWEPDPGRNQAYEEVRYLSGIRPAAVVALCPLLDERLRSLNWDRGKMKDASTFCRWTTERDKFQIRFGVDHKAAYLGCYSEYKSVCRRVAQMLTGDRAKLAELADRIAAVGRPAHVEVQDICTKRGEAWRSEAHRFSAGRGDLSRALRSALDMCARDYHKGALAFRFELWERGRRVRKEEAQARVQQLAPHVLAIGGYLHEGALVG